MVCQQWKPKCANFYNRSTARKSKGKNEKLPTLTSKKSVKNETQLNHPLRHETGAGKKVSLAPKNYCFFKENIVNRKINFKNNFNASPEQKNVNIIKNIRSISSSRVFRRTFSKYENVRRKLKAEFKSAYENSGKFDKSSTKYKSFVNKKRNQKNKSFLKYSVCSSGFIREKKKRKSTVVCQDLPGKGTYNHRFAYDEALRLYQKGIDVDVLYKVKNKTDSIYVINGEFLWAKNRNAEKHKADAKRKAEHRSQKSVEDEALWLMELDRIKKKNELLKTRADQIALREKEKMDRENRTKHEEFLRKKELRETEKLLRAEQLSKYFAANDLKQKRLEKNEKMKKKRRAMEKQRKLKEEEELRKQILRENLEKEKQKRIDFRQNFVSKLKKIKENNIANNKIESYPLEAHNECKVRS